MKFTGESKRKQTLVTNIANRQCDGLKKLNCINLTFRMLKEKVCFGHIYQEKKIGLIQKSIYRAVFISCYITVYKPVISQSVAMPTDHMDIFPELSSHATDITTSPC